MSELADEFRSFCDQLEQKGAERVVIRWIDEKRPIQQEGEGVTVGQVTRVTLKTAVDGEMVERSFEGLDYHQARGILSDYPFTVLDRNDNLTR